MLYLSGSFNYNTDFMRVEVKRLTYFVGASQVVLVVKNLPANAGDTGDLGSIPGSGRCPRRGHGNSFQYSCLENPHGKRAYYLQKRKFRVVET